MPSHLSTVATFAWAESAVLHTYLPCPCSARGGHFSKGMAGYKIANVQQFLKNTYLQCVLAARILIMDFVVCTLAVEKKIRAGFDMSDRTISLSAFAKNIRNNDRTACIFSEVVRVVQRREYLWKCTWKWEVFISRTAPSLSNRDHSNNARLRINGRLSNRCGRNWSLCC
jgi:hypothetical protein